MKIKKMLMLFILITSSSFASSTAEQKQELRKKVYKAQLFIKNSINRDLSGLSGKTNFILDIDLKVNDKKIFEEVGGLDNKWDKLKAMQLPGLFVEHNAQEDLKEIKPIMVETVLSHIEKISISIISPKEIEDVKSFKSTITKILKSNYNRFDKVETEINIKVDKNLLKSKVVTDIKAFTTQKTEIPQEVYVYVAAGLLLFLGILFYIFRDLSGSVKGVKGSIEDKDFSSNITLDSFPSPKKEESFNSPEKNLQSDTSAKEFGAYVTEMRELLVDYSDVFSEMIAFNMETESFVDLVVLMEVVPSETRKSVYAQLPKEKVEKFRSYLMENGEALYSSEADLKAHAKNMVGLLKLSSIDPERFYSYYFKNIIKRLDSTQIKKILKSSSVNELMHLVKYAQSSKVAYAMMDSGFDQMLLSCDYRSLEQTEVKVYLEKIAKTCFATNVSKYTDVREKLLPFLNGDLEEVVLGKLKLNKILAFEDLINAQFDFVVNYVKSLVSSDRRGLLATLSEETRRRIIMELPEILSEQLMSIEDYTITESSLYLKSVLYNELLGSDDVEYKEVAKIEDVAA